MSTAEQNQSRARISPLAWGIFILFIVALIITLVFWLYPENPENHPTAAQTKTTVTLNHDYYVHIHLVEFTPKRPDGKNWDDDGSGPDALVKIFWHGNSIYSVSGRDDQFIATFDLFSVDVWNKLVKGEKLDVETSINAPLVSIAANDNITIEVYDRDLVFNDLALKQNIQLDTLTVGRNDIPIPANSGVVRLQIDLIDRTTPLPDLIDLQSKR